MADIFNTLASNYLTVGAATNYSASKYVDVDKDVFQGTWTGKYADNSKFSVTVSDVTGFRAKVRYQSASTTRFQDVLIKDNAFRIGDSKFTVTRAGVAQVKTVVTNPATGASTLETAFAKQGG